MPRGTDRACAIALAAVAALTLAAPVSADTLRGTVLNAFTEAPIAGARVGVVPSGPEALTDDHGHYELHGAPPLATLAVACDGCDTELLFVRQTAQREATLRVLPRSGTPQQGAWWGMPAPDRGPQIPDVSLHLRALIPVSPLLSVVPEALPETIRVGRRFADTCVGHDVTRIDEVPLEEYVQGVLLPEIGVFRSIAGGPESSRAVFEAFAVAARSYAVWFYLRDPTAPWHIDDTACNQRYDDARSAFVAETVASSANTILVARTDADLLDKLEYAASCGRFGSLPEYQDELVPDVTGAEACVGSWCGHNNCAGHETNPAQPDEGRCLVRGICQWGAAERSMRGDSFEQILAHYQPNLMLRQVGAQPGSADVFGVVLDGSVSPPAPLEGATVSAGGAASTVTDDLGRYELTALPEGDARLTAAAPGFVAEVVVAELVADSRAEVGFVLDPEPQPGADTGADAGSDAGDAMDADVSDAREDPDDASGTPDVVEDAPADVGDAAPVDVAQGDTTSSSPLPRMTSVVGPEGLGETCSTVDAGSLGAWSSVLALVAWHRRRRSRT